MIRYAGQVGYVVEPAHRGHRYAERACRLIMPLAKRHGMDSLWITCQPDNMASRRTLERLGAECVGIFDVPPAYPLDAGAERRKMCFRLALRDSDAVRPRRRHSGSRCCAGSTSWARTRCPMKALASALGERGLARGPNLHPERQRRVPQRERDPDALAKKIARLVARNFACAPLTLVISKAELAAAIRANPFPDAQQNHKLLHLYFLASRPEVARHRLAVAPSRCRSGGVRAQARSLLSLDAGRVRRFGPAIEGRALPGRPRDRAQLADGQ